MTGRDAILVPRLEVEIAEDDVLHFLGYPAGRDPGGRVASRLHGVLREARALAAARGAFREVALEEAREIGLPPEPATALVLGLVTAGAGIEERAAERMRQGDATGALLMDAAGSAAAEEAAGRLGARIAGASARPARDVSCRVSPGYGGWPLSAQPALFARLPHVELGVSLTASWMMVPRKSVSFAMWLGAERVPRAGLSGCDTCGLDLCRYRRSAVPSPAS